MNEISPIFDQSFQSLEQAMKVATLRQSVIAHNIANANTPGYVPQSFDEELMKAVKRQDKKQVVIEDEMSELTKNSQKYSAYIKLMSSKLTVMRSIASQGKR